MDGHGAIAWVLEKCSSGSLDHSSPPSMTLLWRSHSPISLASSLFCDLFLPDPDLTLPINDFFSVTLAEEYWKFGQMGWWRPRRTGGWREGGGNICSTHLGKHKLCQLVGPALGSNSLSLSFFLCLSQQSLVSTMHLHDILFYKYFLPSPKMMRQITHDLPFCLIPFGLIPDCSEQFKKWHVVLISVSSSLAPRTVSS